MTELIQKLKKQAGKNKIKQCIVGIIGEMLLVAPECVSAVIDNEKGIDQVYDKLRSMRSGSDSEILKVVADVYKMPVEFEIEMRIVRKNKSKDSGEQKIIDLFDFI